MGGGGREGHRVADAGRRQQDACMTAIKASGIVRATLHIRRCVMADLLRDLIDNARRAQTDRASVATLTRQIQVSAQHHRPSDEAVIDAVKLGEASVVEALLSSNKLDADARTQVATQGFATWCDNPLASRQSVAIAQALLAGGANALARFPSGASLAERLAEQLGTIEGGEQRLREAGQQGYRTGPGEILRAGWRAMEAAHVDLRAAQQVREAAQRRAPAIADWRKRQGAEASVSGLGAPGMRR